MHSLANVPVTMYRLTHQLTEAVERTHIDRHAVGLSAEQSLAVILSTLRRFLMGRNTKYRDTCKDLAYWLCLSQCSFAGIWTTWFGRLGLDGLVWTTGFGRLDFDGCIWTTGREMELETLSVIWLAFFILLAPTNIFITGLLDYCTLYLIPQRARGTAESI